jgi:hypothetical protein
MEAGILRKKIKKFSQKPGLECSTFYLKYMLLNYVLWISTS